MTAFLGGPEVLPRKILKSGTSETQFAAIRVTLVLTFSNFFLGRGGGRLSPPRFLHLWSHPGIFFFYLSHPAYMEKVFITMFFCLIPSGTLAGSWVGQFSPYKRSASQNCEPLRAGAQLNYAESLFRFWWRECFISFIYEWAQYTIAQQLLIIGYILSYSVILWFVLLYPFPMNLVKHSLSNCPVWKHIYVLARDCFASHINEQTLISIL